MNIFRGEHILIGQFWFWRIACVIEVRFTFEIIRLGAWGRFDPQGDHPEIILCIGLLPLSGMLKANFCAHGEHK